MTINEIAKNIKLLAFDVDGVMTDGSITYDENGIEYKTFNAKDGHGLAKMAKNGFITANKKDSQEICFVEDNDYANFIQKNYNYTNITGEFVDTKGNKYGKACNGNI